MDYVLYETESNFRVSGDETILVVEDEQAVRQIIERTLKENGYHLIAAENGKAALKKAKEYKGKIHLLLSDVVMPAMSGQELSEKIREYHPEILVCFMSGYTDDAILRHGVLEKDVEFIQKPFSSPKLVLKIREILDSI